MTSTRKQFRKLLAEPRLTVMAGAYDALSARIIESEGFPTIVAGGYAAIGSLLAQADGGQLNLRDYAAHYARIVAAVEIPVYVDADTGFGGTSNVRQMVRAFETAGVAGFLLGDQTFPNRCGYMPGKQVVPPEQMIARIKAAVDARRDADLVICARTDATSVEGLAAAIERCDLYLEAGADLAKPMGADELADIERVIQEVPCQHITTQSQAAGAHAVTFAELERIGVAAVTLPSIALFAAAQGVRHALRTVRKDNSLVGVGNHLIPLSDYYDLVALKAQLEREECYDKAATALVAARKKTRAKA
jgi:methylisocitrate lyase